MPSPLQPPVQYAPRWLVGGFFGALLALGLLLYQDFGVSWDEPVNRINGLVNLRYVADLVAPQRAAAQPKLQGLPAWSTYPDKDYGVLLELPIAWLDILRPRADLGDYYRLHHLLTYLVCLGGTWALYRLASLRFRNEWLGLLTASLLVLSPRMFAESFYNSKDLVFLALFTVGMYTLVRLVERPTLGRCLLHALATAAAIDVRILGAMLLPFTAVMLVLEARIETQYAVQKLPLWQLLLVYLSATAAATVAGWPYLWADPLGHFGQAFENMSRFRWPGKVLYWGEEVAAQNLPWHYAPAWILLTTPVAYSLGGLVALLHLGWQVARTPFSMIRAGASRLDLLFAGWLLLPVLLVITLNSVLYDGWRHLYFVYPALLLLAVSTAQKLWQRAASSSLRLVQLGVLGLAILEMGFTALRMVRMHPNQQTYFSFLPRHQVEQLFERDYWGLSYRQGLEYVVAQQPTGPIPIDVSHVPMLDNNKVLLAPADQARLLYMPTAAGRYFITAYRRYPGEYPDSVGQEVFTVRADGVKILSVFRRATGTPLPQPNPGNERE
jgi:hypothetical protein